ncbi:MAG: hypothetical protein U0524_02765 [Candidatus Saccharimonadales bacterium]
MAEFIRLLEEHETHRFMPMRELYDPQQEEVYEAAGEYLIEEYEFSGVLNAEYRMLIELNNGGLVEFECGADPEVKIDEGSVCTGLDRAAYAMANLSDFKEFAYEAMVDAWRAHFEVNPVSKPEANAFIAEMLAKDLIEGGVVDIDKDEALNLCKGALLEAEYLPSDD